jgi:tetratricopeptide (TPR) repeat protein
MNQPLRVTEEQIAAAKLRIELDTKLGRETPALLRDIAAATPSRPDEPENKIALFPVETQAEADQGEADRPGELRDRIAAHRSWPFTSAEQIAEKFDKASSRLREAWNLLLLASEHNETGDHVQAERFLQQAMKCFSDLGTAALDGQDLTDAHLARTYQLLDQPRRALAAFEKTTAETRLPIRAFKADRLGKARLFLARAGAHLQLDQNPAAADYASQALALFRELEDRGGEAAALAHLSITSERLGEHANASEQKRLADDILRELGLAAE